MTIVVSGIAKMFVGELIETGKQTDPLVIEIIDEANVYPLFGNSKDDLSLE